MADVTAELQNLIQGLQATDPRLYQALAGMIDQIQGLYLQLNPLVTQSQLQASIDQAVIAPADFSFSFTNLSVRFNWSAVEGAAQYEIRLGSSWNTATLVFRSSSLQGDIDPLLIGTYAYLIKSITASGTYSTTPTPLVVTVPAIGTVTIMSQIIDNNILLFWTEPISSFAIDYYEVFKGGVSLGILTGTFFTRFETVGGTFTYSVRAFDVAGNESPESLVTLVLKNPPDFQLTDTRTSTFNGTLVNTALQSNGRLLGDIDTAETFENHFITRGWASPQAQITAGYPIYIQPTLTTGSYEEKIDYGVAVNSIIVSINYNQNQVSGSTTLTVEMKVSLDDITYSAYVAGATQFYSTFRYLKFKITFAGTDDKALMEIYNLVTRLDVKRENDGGIIAAVSTDVGGTQVNFTKAFHDIDSVTATPMGTVERKVIVDFTDIPDPVGFKVLLYDTAGARVSGDVRWAARGVV